LITPSHADHDLHATASSLPSTRTGGVLIVHVDDPTNNSQEEDT
jgi:hypothetical protein